MSKVSPQTSRYLRTAGAILGTALLISLIVRAGSDKLIENARR